MSNVTNEMMARPMWRDRAAQISLGLAILLNLLLFALVLLTYQQLNEAVSAAGDAAAGAAAEVRASNPLVLPIIGLVTWIVGGALGAFYYRLRDEAPMAYIIWAAVVVIEVATWVPALTLIIDP